jgi:hypothetical protein
MSTNLHLHAETIPSGHTKKTVEAFNLFQTPTTTTYQILESKDILQAYANWANPPTSDNGWHIESLKDFIESHPAPNWKLVWEAW